MTSDGASSRAWRRALAAFGLFGLVVIELAVAAAAAHLSGLTRAEAIDGFVVTNVAIGLSCAVAGVLVAWQRPRLPLGWLLLGAGVSQTATAAAAPLIVLGSRRGWPEPVLRTLDTLFAFAWPWSIALFLPLALLVFPDGLLPGRFWRATVWWTVITRLVFVAAVGADPAQVVGGRTLRPWLVLSDHARLAPLWVAYEIAWLAVLVAAVVGLVLRYRRATSTAAVSFSGWFSP